MGDQKNLILAAVLSFIVIGLWEAFIIAPQREEAQRAAQIQAERQAADPTDPDGIAPQIGEGAAPQRLDRAAALALNQRIVIDSPRVDGSISLKGGRIDDLNLKDYRVTIDDDSPEVTLLSPSSGPAPYYAVFGWTGKGAGDLPGPATEWVLAEGDALGAGSPVVLEWTNDSGVTFRQRYKIDDNYLFTVTQEIENGTGETLTLRPYGIVARHGLPETLGFYLLHEGAIGAFDGITEDRDYGDLDDLSLDVGERAQVEKIDVAENGWVGFTDKYWLSALIPEPGTPFTAAFKRSGQTEPVYQTDARLPALTVEAGAGAANSVHFFAGAKEADILRHYENTLGVDRFYEAIDWGWFYFLTKPFFWILNSINKLVGNFGVAIILLTLLVKAVMFPLAYKSYVSMGPDEKAPAPDGENPREIQRRPAPDAAPR